MIAGQFNELTGAAQLLYALKLDAASAARATLETASGRCGKYLVVAYDANDQWLGQASACLWQLEDGTPGRSLFMAQLPAVAQAVRVEFVSAQQPTVALASLVAGLRPPTVKIITPQSGAVALNPLRIAWKAEDPDGDTLRFTVRYSRDNGVTWQVIADETPRTSIEFNTKGLAGGNGSCRIQVLASDGLHTAEAISDAFTVPTKTPQASISFETA